MTDKTTMQDLGEFGLIEQLKQILKTDSQDVILGIGDDTSVTKSSASDKYSIITTDMLIEDVHFTFNTGYTDVGHKSLACSVSDIAAMGGLPKYALISIGVPTYLKPFDIKKIYLAMHNLAQKYKINIIGGDTVRSEKLIINVTLTGEVSPKDIVYRSGAKEGDLIYVTGSLGKSLDTKHHLTFEPRIKESQFLIKNVFPTSMMDISDGLASDLGQICQASGVGAEIQESKIPRRDKSSLNEALYDGEDFELLFTVKPELKDKLKKSTGLSDFACIGTITNIKNAMQCVSSEGESIVINPQKGFSHFK